MREILTRSHYIAPSDPPLLTKSFHEILNQTCKINSNKEAFIFHPENERVTFGNLKIQVDKIASGLLSLGLCSGDLLAIADRNNAAFISTALAAMKIGVIFIGINPMMEQAQLIPWLSKMDCKAIVCNEICYTNLVKSCPEIEAQSRLKIKNIEKIPSLHHVVVTGERKQNGAFLLSEIMELASKDKDLNNIYEFIHPENICCVHTTSGSTGQPKAVTCTYQQILNNGYFFGRRLNHSCQNHITCIPAPLWRGGVFMTSVIPSIIFGITTVFPPIKQKPDIGAILDVIEMERCTAIRGIPKLIQGLIKHDQFSVERVSSLKTVITGGDPTLMTEEYIKSILHGLQIEDLLYVVIMTEANVILMMSSPPTSYPLQSWILPHHEVKIVNFEEEIVPIEKIGEVYVRGCTIVKSYWKDEERNQKLLMQDGWLKTEDLGIMQQNGSVRIIGRCEDFIFSCDELISFTSLKDILMLHENIQDAQLIKLPHPMIDNKLELFAFLVTKNGNKIEDKELIDLYKVKKVETHPKYFIFIDTIPILYADKIDRRKLKELATVVISSKN